MKASTFIRAGRKALSASNDAAVQCLTFPWDAPNRKRAHRKHVQAVKFFARAIQLADEQHDLIAVQEQQLEQFAHLMQEAHSNA